MGYYFDDGDDLEIRDKHHGLLEIFDDCSQNGCHRPVLIQ